MHLQEKVKKQEEIKRLKHLKKMEILEKIEKLKEATGNSSLDFTENDIEDDFDADQYDKMMKVNILLNENHNFLLYACFCIWFLGTGSISCFKFMDAVTVRIPKD